MVVPPFLYLIWPWPWRKSAPRWGFGFPTSLWVTRHCCLLSHTVRRLLGSAADALDSFGKPDILHDNGIWLSHNHRLAKLSRRRCIPRIVSTRGMLEPWAMRHKYWKKRVAWWLYQRRDLMPAACVHTTAEREIAERAQTRARSSSLYDPERGRSPTNRALSRPIRGVVNLVVEMLREQPSFWAGFTR